MSADYTRWKLAHSAAWYRGRGWSTADIAQRLGVTARELQAAVIAHRTAPRPPKRAPWLDHEADTLRRLSSRQIPVDEMCQYLPLHSPHSIRAKLGRMT